MPQPPGQILHPTLLYVLADVDLPAPALVPAAAVVGLASGGRLRVAREVLGALTSSIRGDAYGAAMNDGEKRPAQICREHNLSESVLLKWRKEYEARGEAAFTEKQPSANEALEARIAELERLCGQLSLENQILNNSLE